MYIDVTILLPQNNINTCILKWYWLKKTNEYTCMYVLSKKCIKQDKHAFIITLNVSFYKRRNCLDEIHNKFYYNFLLLS